MNPMSLYSTDPDALRRAYPHTTVLQLVGGPRERLAHEHGGHCPGCRDDVPADAPIGDHEPDCPFPTGAPIYTTAETLAVRALLTGRDAHFRYAACDCGAATGTNGHNLGCAITQLATITLIDPA